MFGGQHFKGEMNIHVLWVNYIAMIYIKISFVWQHHDQGLNGCDCLLLFLFVVVVCLLFPKKVLHSALIGVRMLWRLLMLHFYRNLTSAPFPCLLGIHPCMRWDTLLCTRLQNVVNKLIDRLFIFLWIITICATLNRFKGGFLVRGNAWLGQKANVYVDDVC